MDREMTDKELLMLAARAAGIQYELDKDGIMWTRDPWFPLTDGGDALRLAVKLGMQMYIWQPDDGIGAHYTEVNRRVKEPHGKDPCAATRRAIVRAAAEIGRAMK